MSTDAGKFLIALQVEGKLPEVASGTQQTNQPQPQEQATPPEQQPAQPQPQGQEAQPPQGPPQTQPQRLRPAGNRPPQTQPQRQATQYQKPSYVPPQQPQGQPQAVQLPQQQRFDLKSMEAQRWEKSKDQRDKLGSAIQKLKQKGVKDAGAWEEELRSLVTLGGNDPGKAGGMFDGLQEKVKQALLWDEVSGMRAAVERDINDLKEKGVQLADALSNELLALNETATKDAAAAINGLAKLKKKVAGAAEWPALAGELANARDAIEPLWPDGVKGDQKERWLQLAEGSARKETKPGEEGREVEDRRWPIEVEVERIQKKADNKTYGNPPNNALAALLARMGQLHAKFQDQADTLQDFPAALDELNKLDAVLVQIRKFEAVNAMLLQMQLEKITEPAAQRAEMVNAAKKDPDTLRLLAADPAGGKLLDALVAEIGDEEGSQDEAESSDEEGSDEEGSQDEAKFLEEAIKARFGLRKLKGDNLEQKSLLRLYKVMGMVPLSHTAGNLCLRSVKENATLGTSWYSPGSKKVVLNTGRPGQYQWKFDADEGSTEAPSEVEHFDETTLHEVGHAVDDGQGYMRANQGKENHGAWKQETLDSVVAAVRGDDKLGKFFTDYQDRYTEPFLTSYLMKALSGKIGLAEAASDAQPDELEADPAVVKAVSYREKVKLLKKGQYWMVQDYLNDAMRETKAPDPAQRALVQEVVEKILNGAEKDVAVRDVLASYKKSDTAGGENSAELAQHPAVAWCEAVRLKSASKGLWDQGKAGAENNALGGRVYQQASPSQWFSYALAARKNGVSSYQFRAPAEWFAEAYAAYFLERLSQSHPLYDWLKKEEEKG
jgi:hypothetical protein